jgi:hypothetical protein
MNNYNKSDILPLLIHEKNPNSVNLHSLFCDLPEGGLEAKSRKRVTFIFHPLKSGFYEYHIFVYLFNDNDRKENLVDYLNDLHVRGFGKIGRHVQNYGKRCIYVFMNIYMHVYRYIYI